MVHLEYLEKSLEKVTIECETPSNAYEMDVVGSKRPTKKNCKKICTSSEEGKVIFKDKARNTFQQTVSITKLKLYYEDELVSMRKIPKNTIFAGDELEVNFALTIKNTREGGDLTSAELML